MTMSFHLSWFLGGLNSQDSLESSQSPMVCRCIHESYESEHKLKLMTVHHRNEYTARSSDIYVINPCASNSNRGAAFLI